MMNMATRTVGALLLVASLAAVLAGCTTDNTTNTKMAPSNMSNVTNRLETLAESIPQVADATAIIVGKTAIVGIDVNGKLDRSQVDTIKYAVAKAVRKDAHGKRAIVTADADLGQRILTVRNGVMNGRPLSAFTNELGDIIGRLAPQMNSAPNR
jgi:YhcN/YlaJ family sporulation lipoprotein